jgi:hypothetical protein
MVVRIALALAAIALVAAALPAPGHLVALGAAVAALGLGLVEYPRRELPGRQRLGAAAAIAVGSLGLVLAVVRIAAILSAIAHVDRMLD